MTAWLLSWKGFLVGAVILLAAIAFGIAFRENSPAANIATIVGLAVSVLGFIVTIWTVLDARQQIREAGIRAENAIRQGRDEARRTVEGIASQLLASSCASLLNGVESLRQAAQDADWSRTIYRCQECRKGAYNLAQDHHLTDEEKSSLRAAADDFLLIQQFIESYRREEQTGTLKKSHIQRLDEVIGLLTQIQARFLHEPLRPAQGSSQNP